MTQSQVPIRPTGRMNNQLRTVRFTPGYTVHAEGSCLVEFGGTKVLCTASVEAKPPPFLRNSGKGWVTAEYGMLPRSTHSRSEREAARGKQSGRTHEIQRLIGRSMRMSLDLVKLGERQIKVDCDVLQADGGTRTASICGAWVALHHACNWLVKQGQITESPMVDQIAAISCGIWQGAALLDLDYSEDSTCDADANFVMNSAGKMIELQFTAEKHAVSDAEIMTLIALSRQGIVEIMKLQQEAVI